MDCSFIIFIFFLKSIASQFISSAVLIPEHKRTHTIKLSLKNVLIKNSINFYEYKRKFHANEKQNSFLNSIELGSMQRIHYIEETKIEIQNISILSVIVLSISFLDLNNVYILIYELKNLSCIEMFPKIERMTKIRGNINGIIVKKC